MFHELILQIGNREDTGAETETGERAKEILDEYCRGFQERNPNLYVFSAHLHMDEATPHAHIDFVPYITGSRRGLDTRVSLKKALEAEGFQLGVSKTALFLTTPVYSSEIGRSIHKAYFFPGKNHDNDENGIRNVINNNQKSGLDTVLIKDFSALWEQ